MAFSTSEINHRRRPSAALPPNLDPPKFPRNMLTNFAYFTISPPLILARRLKGRSYHDGWSFRNEHATGWLKYTLGSGDYKAWRRLMTMSVVMAKAKTAHTLDIQPVKQATFKAYWITLKSQQQSQKKKKDWVMVYFHGGGYLTGAPLLHALPYQTMLQHLQKAHNIDNFAIFAVKYPLAPEHPYPAQLDTALEAYRHLVEQEGYSPDRILMGGDSAGGNLALVLSLRLRELGYQPSLGLVLISPWVELITEIPSYATKADTRRDYLSPRCARSFITAFLGSSGGDLKDPLISPIYADLTGLPEMMVCWGGVELFREQISRFVESARSSGVPVTSYVDPNMPHAFPVLMDFYPKNAKMGLRQVADWMAAKISTNL